ncbi:hypothetical protein IAR55_005114 [Kwoniella newhampshirensis]|uniref:Uncharacterized protein n=1 Tax=Kwoniella newhampshirensis TaxID=1651941 RepID=A0AAW0Z048_9TREE
MENQAPFDASTVPLPSSRTSSPRSTVFLTPVSEIGTKVALAEDTYTERHTTQTESSQAGIVMKSRAAARQSELGETPTNTLHRLGGVGLDLPTGHETGLVTNDDEDISIYENKFDDGDFDGGDFDDEDEDDSSPQLPADTDAIDPTNIVLPLTPDRHSAPRNASTPPQPPSQTTKTTKHILANRRPLGWISSLSNPRILSDHPPNLSPKGGLTPPRSISIASGRPRPRISSVHSQGGSTGGSGRGRRVSGAMQYAFASRSSLDAALDEPYCDDEDQTGQEQDDAVEGDRSTEYLTREEEQQVRYEVGSSQDQDEVWMAYVRQQLGALFPDFFPAEPNELVQASPRARDQAVDEDDEEGDQDDTALFQGRALAHTPSNTDGGPVIQTPTRTAHDHPSTILLTTTSSSTTEDSPLFSPSQNHRNTVVGATTVPNVRNEIGELRDEIERLRSVVGGLAEGMRGASGPGSGPGAGKRPVDRASLEVDMSDGTVGKETKGVTGNSAIDDDQSPETSGKTDSLLSSIIRALDQKINKTDTLRSDDLVFSPQNLSRLLASVERLNLTHLMDEPPTTVME